MRSPAAQRPRWTHPRWCSPQLCHDGAADVMHRSAVGRVIPHQDGDPATPALTWSLEQTDEKQGDRQVENPPIARIGIGEATVCVELDELAELIDGLVGLHRRGRAQPMTNYAG